MRTLFLPLIPLVAAAPFMIRLYSATPPIPDGDYMIQNEANRLVLDDPFSSRKSGEQIIRWNWNNGPNQKWHFVHHWGGRYTIQNVRSGLFLTDPGSSAGREAPLQQQSARNDGSQFWHLEQKGTSFIIYSKARHLMVDDPGAGSGLGTGIVLVSDSRNPPGNSRWTIRKNDHAF